MMKYVVLDIETTGLDLENSSIIEVGIIIVEGNAIKDKYSSFVAYEGELPETVKRLTGITEDMLSNAPPIDQVIEEMQIFIGKLPVVAHNGFGFDFPILEREGIKFKEKHDSMEFAFFVLPTNPEGHSMSALAEYFNMPKIIHRALDDCKMEFSAIQELQKKYGEKQVDKRRVLKGLAERTGWWWTNFLSSKPKNVDSIANLISEYKPYRKQNTQQEVVKFESQAIDLDEVHKQFVVEGVSAKNSDYSEDRPEQREMAALIAETFNNNHHAVIEVGTGTGKSKAYLVPSLLFALKNNIPVIISTHTKVLQDQLYNKEIPHLKEIINPELRVAVLKGKKNYVCVQKFEEFSEEVIQKLSQRSLYLFSESGTRFTLGLANLLLTSWIIETERGDWEEIPYWLKEKIPKTVEMTICNLDELCGANMCDLYDSQKCFLAKARLGARDADLVIINHAIALSGIIIENEDVDDLVKPDREADSKSYSHTVFPGEAKFIVFDEAHHLEDDATSAWEYLVSEGSMQFLLQQLYGSTKNIVESISKKKGNEHLISIVKNFKEGEGDLKLNIETIFKRILPELIPADKDPKNTVYRILDEIPEDLEIKKAFLESVNDLSSRLKNIKQNLGTVADYAEPIKIRKILKTRAGVVGQIVQAVDAFISNDKQYVRYIERFGTIIELKSAPLSVAPYLKQFVYDNFSSVILTSATLTTNKSFKFFSGRCGTSLVDTSKIDYHLFKSSFDYTKQCKFFIPKGISYSGKVEEHLRKSAAFLENAIIASEGGALILCSSHRQVDALYEKLVRPLALQNIWLLRQSKGSSPNSVIRDFKKDINSTLIGTKTLWQGIDIPGESLRSLFILKIPYHRPDDPLIKARRNEIDSIKGGNSFADYYEPLAALAIKQGFGRLIRKSTDTGIAIFLDEDILKKHRILGSLPEGVPVYLAEPEDIFTALHSA